MALWFIPSLAHWNCSLGADWCARDGIYHWSMKLNQHIGALREGRSFYQPRYFASAFRPEIMCKCEFVGRKLPANLDTEAQQRASVHGDSLTMYVYYVKTSPLFFFWSNSVGEKWWPWYACESLFFTVSFSMLQPKKSQDHMIDIRRGLVPLIPNEEKRTKTETLEKPKFLGAQHKPTDLIEIVDSHKTTQTQ